MHMLFRMTENKSLPLVSWRSSRLMRMDFESLLFVLGVWSTVGVDDGVGTPAAAETALRNSLS